MGLSDNRSAVKQATNTGRRHRIVARQGQTGLAIMAAMGILLQSVAVSAAPTVGTSTTGVRILTIPTPDSLFEVGPGEPPVAFHPPLQPVAMAGDVVVMNDPIAGGVLVWDGNGYPRPIADDFPTDALLFADDVNSSGAVVGSVSTGGQTRGYVWSEDGGYLDVGDPPGSVPDVASDPSGFGPQVRVTGIAETGWIVGRFRAAAGVCSVAVNSCGFRGVPNGAGYDLIPFDGLFSPQDIELVTLGGGAPEHMAVGSPSGIWTETAGIAALDDGGTGGIVDGVDLNQSGEIVGSVIDLSVPSNPTVVAAYWPSPGGVFTAIPADGFVEAIGDDGTVVGIAGFPFSWTPGSGSVTDLGRLPGDLSSQAYVINGSGQIAGTSNGRAVIFDLTGAYGIDYPPHIDLGHLYATAEPGQNLVYTPVVTELEGDPWIVEWENLPAGAVWSDGSLSWPTTPDDVGVHTPTMTVSVPGELNTASSAVVTLEVAEQGRLILEVVEPGPTTATVVGAPVSFVFDVINDGPDAATSVSATVDVPSGAVVEDLDPGCEYVELSSTVECAVGTLLDTQRVAFTVRFPASGDVPVEIIVEGQIDSNPTGDSTVVLVQVAGTVADLSIGLVGPTSTRFLAGESIPFVFNVDNAGPDEAGGVTALVDLPPGVTVSDLDGGCIDPAGTVDVMCDLGNVIGSKQFGFSASFTDAGNFVVDATVTGQASDPDLTNNAVFPRVEIVGQADLLDPIGDRTVSPLSALAFSVTSVAAAPVYRVRWMNPPGGGSTVSLPAGMSTNYVGADLDELDVAWTPTIGQVGFYEFEFAVIDEDDPDNPLADSELVRILVQGLPLRGTTWADLDEDGTRTGPTGELEPLIGGVTVYIDEDDDGSRDAGEPAATSANGYFYFAGYAPVNHEFVVRQELPADFVQTTPSFGDGIQLTLAGSNPSLSLDFGSRPTDPTAVPQIFGTIWNDVDCTTGSEGETGVAGVRVRVERLGLDGVFFPYATALAGPDGSYAFSGLPGDTYRVHMDVPAGFEHTAPGSTNTVANYQVVVDGTLLHGGKDFGVAAAESCPGAIYGTVWHDVDRNGVIDTDEDPLDLLFASTWLDEDNDSRRDRGEPLGYLVGAGRYRIHPVAPGNHIVRSAIPSTFPIRTAPGGDDSYLVSLAPGETVSSIDFGFATDDDPDDRPPTVRSISDQVVIAGDRLEVEIVASDPENDPFTLSLGTNPGGDIVDGAYVWETLDAAPGTYRVTVYVTQNDDPTKVGLSIFDVEILSRDGDDDGDSIANAIDGYVVGGFPFVSQADVLSFDFTDRHREGPSPDGVGTSFGTVFSASELIVTDAADPAVGVLAVTGGASAAVRFCGSRASTILGAGSSTEHTCGSHTMTVLAGSGSLATSDGAVIDVTAGSTVNLEDGGGPVSVTVVVGTATVTVGGSSVVLDETDPVLIDPGDVLGDDDEDGLSNAEEAMTGTDPDNPDTDGDGVVDSIDSSWLIDYLDDVSAVHFKRRVHRTLIKFTIRIAAAAVSLGMPDRAVEFIDALDRRVDGCGDSPDRTDWILDCATQVEFRNLLALYRRGISTASLS